MKLNEIIENNKLIAEFIEFPKHEDTNGKRLWEYEEDSLCYTEHLIFHESWNWLMPIVEKINEWNPSIRPFKRIPENVEITITPKKIRLSGMIWSTNDKNIGKWIMLRNTYKPSNITSVWKAVVDFIKWYNENKHETG